MLTPRVIPSTGRLREGSKPRKLHKSQSKTRLGIAIDGTASPNHTLTNTAIHTFQRQQLSGATWPIPSSIKSQLTVLNRLLQKPGASSAGKLRTPYSRTYASKWMISDVLIQIHITQDSEPNMHGNPFPIFTDESNQGLKQKVL